VRLPKKAATTAKPFVQVATIKSSVKKFLTCQYKFSTVCAQCVLNVLAIAQSRGIA